MKRVRTMLPVADAWRPVLLGLIGILLVLFVLSFRLNSIPAGYSASEQEFVSNSTSIVSIADNPLYLHHKLGQLGLSKTVNTSPALMRLPSLLAALSLVVAVYYLLKTYYTTRIAVFGVLLVSTSSWLLHIARLATPQSSYLLFFLAVLAGVWIERRRLTPLAEIFVAFLSVILLYIPGLLWFIAPLILWQRRRINRMLRAMPPWRQAVFLLILIIGSVPLVWAIAKDTSLIIPWLGLPEVWPESFYQYLRNIAGVPLEIFVTNGSGPETGLANLSRVGIFTSVMTSLGIFALFYRRRLDRAKYLLGSGVLAILLIGLGGTISSAILLPIVYTLAIGGIALLLQQWFTIFPKNPFARAVGVTLIIIPIMLTAYYHLNKYYVAWANAPETKSVFSNKLE